MNKFPSIAIAIPTFNEEKNIDRCLGSIFRQKYAGKLEVFVVDTDSQDGTLEIAAKYPVKIIRSKVKDLLEKKKIALDKSTSKYFMYLDADIDLPTTKWFERMVKPLEEDLDIVGSFTGYVSNPNDEPLNKYITLDFLQRDPIFRWLTPSLSSVVVQKRKGYMVCEYSKNKMLPAGLCIFRRRELLASPIGKRKKFNELDNIVILNNLGRNKYAYVPGTKLHHPFIKSFWTLIKKRRRNIFNMYFDQPEQRLWTWIDWKSPVDLIKIVIWLIYTNSLVFPFFVGVWKSVKHRTWVGLLEPIFNLVDTNVIAISFLQKYVSRKLYEAE